MTAKSRDRDGELFYLDNGRLKSKPRTIWRAVYDSNEDFPEVLGTYDLLMDMAGRPIREWEDERLRTKDQVLDLFDRAIAAVAPTKEYAQEP